MQNLKRYSRFFAFGCSMTDYWWPTWADIIANEFETAYNFGRSGAGNTFISLQIAEANQRYKFNKNDLVMVMWTGTTREDRYINNYWQTPGNIYSQDFYDAEYIRRYSDVRGYLIRDLGLISLSDKLLESTGCTYHMLNMSPFVKTPSRYFDFMRKNPLEGLEDVIELYKPVIEKLKPDLLTVGCNGEWPKVKIYHNENQRVDYHPTTLTHYEYLKKLFPDLKLSLETVYWLMEQDEKVKNAKNISELDPKVWKTRTHQYTIL